VVVVEDPSGETGRGAVGGGDTIVGKQDQRAEHPARRRQDNEVPRSEIKEVSRVAAGHAVTRSNVFSLIS
jgi:hypothetical protein